MAIPATRSGPRFLRLGVETCLFPAVDEVNAVHPEIIFDGTPRILLGAEIDRVGSKFNRHISTALKLFWFVTPGWDSHQVFHCT